MAENQEGLVNLTKPVTMTFPNLFEAKAVQIKGKPSGDPKYSANFEFDADSEDLKTMKAKAVAIARAKWPGCNLADYDFPFNDGNKLADKAKANSKDREFSRGKAVLTSRSKYQPRLSVIDGGKVVDLDDALMAVHKGKFYSGVEALAQFNFVAYDGVGNNRPGVTAYLGMVLSTNKGAKLAGGASAADVFKGYVGTTSDFDPTAAGLDEIPF